MVSVFNVCTNLSDSIDNELNLGMSLAFKVLNINTTRSEEKNINLLSCTI